MASEHRPQCHLSARRIPFVPVQKLPGKVVNGQLIRQSFAVKDNPAKERIALSEPKLLLATAKGKPSSAFLGLDSASGVGWVEMVTHVEIVDGVGVVDVVDLVDVVGSAENSSIKSFMN